MRTLNVFFIKVVIITKRFFKHQVKEPVLRAKLTPNYELGCKRIALSTEYYPALRNQTIVNADGTLHKPDVIILATGFLARGYFSPLKVVGRGGEDLYQKWKVEGPNAYATAHNSLLFQMECQVGWVVNAIKEMVQRQARTITVKREAEEKYMQFVQSSFDGTVWNSSCSSWYSNERGVITLLWPKSLVMYYLSTRHWSKQYPDRTELLEYIRNVAKKYDLFEKVKFQHRVNTLRWDEGEGKWHVTVLNMNTELERTLKFDIVISAVGVLRVPNYPAQFENFKGPKLHTANWNSEVNLENKVVAVIGTGASALQVIPEIVDKVKELIVYQRYFQFRAAEGPTAYLGIISHAAPNLFFLVGPNTATAHNSLLFQMECQVGWVVNAIKEMFQRQARTITVKREAEEKYMQFVQSSFDGTVWNSSCSSWYSDERGVITLLWPKPLVTYYLSTCRVDCSKLEFS
ncbi:Baeyer-Villiger monooxygenase [Orchesella cincta]|uniref:Flavin-containing monooxygenase n=1 Tax=Orchesella cincta TaxID=48709 RepID=A0A1D2M923_ORCCI|nr:Baeyer-Villiger monooxygenase [Orchesella cincta]